MTNINSKVFATVLRLEDMAQRIENKCSELKNSTQTKGAQKVLYNLTLDLKALNSDIAYLREVCNA